MKIIIDVMGGDNAPSEILKGTVEAYEKFRVDMVLVGDKNKIDDAAKENQIDLSHFEIVHTDVTVNMDDDPLSVIHAKKESSLNVGLQLLADGKGDAFVSAGNTGALFTAASLIVRKIPGIQRAAIASILPMKPPVLLLDAGANVSVTDEYLEQFAVIGTIYMKSVLGNENPRVGLLNNGSESCKGTQLQVDAYRRLSGNEYINFIGNIEANKVPLDVCDVLVTDGFTGNILLKSIEGMGKLMNNNLRDCIYTNILTKFAGLLMKKQLKGFKKNFDPSTYGGAPLLGLRKPVIKAHGSSNAKAIKNAILQAINYSANGVIEKSTQEIKKISKIKKPTEGGEKPCEPIAAAENP